MHLIKIKLGGFKSFVDPTSFTLPSNLIGIVGPNGCGKSNIIDAVRWVMGESSARLLRGESMDDVIFSGSNSRKPVGSAFVELHFDNRDGTIGGEYAKYSEIAIKRSVARESGSQYYLNGTKCRRRDITDIFLGTGLGPRSYSIIEQGMISRLVESKPEELRMHIEEAAGISKYKERRKDTESRIKRTRANLERLADLLDEINKHIAHLKRQARAAERYTVLKQEERQKQAEVQLSLWREKSAETQSFGGKLRAAETEQEAVLAQQRKLEAEIEIARTQLEEANASASKVQARLYEIGGECARLEQSISHAVSLSASQSQELQEVLEQRKQLDTQLQRDQVQAQEISRWLQENAAGLGDLQTLAAEAEQERQQLGSTLSDARIEHAKSQVVANQLARQADVLRANLTHLERHIEDAKDRIGQIKIEVSNSGSALQSQREETRKDVAALQAQISNSEKDLAALANSHASSQAKRDELKSLRDECAEEITGTRAHLASLRAVQQKLTPTDDAELSQWLQQQGLREGKSLAQLIKVEKGWEDAVEVALGPFLGARGTQELASLLQSAEMPSGTALFDLAGKVQPPGDSSLVSKVEGPAALTQFLAGIHFADDVAAAEKLLQSFDPGHRVITRQGQWLGNGWYVDPKKGSGTSGVLERDRQIEELLTSLATTEGLMEKRAKALVTAIEAHQHCAQKMGQARSNHAQLLQQLAVRESTLGQLSQRLEDEQRRAARNATQLVDLDKVIIEDAGRISADTTALETLMDQMAAASQEVESVHARVGELVKAHEAAQARAQKLSSKAHELALATESRSATSTSLESAIERQGAALTAGESKGAALRRRIDEALLPVPEMKEKLQTSLAERLDVERELTTRREAQEAIQADIRLQEQQRHQFESRLSESREALERVRLAQQSARIQGDAFAAEVKKSGFDLQELDETLDKDANSNVLEEALQHIVVKRQRLEPVNLAAIKEFDEESERKDYLDAQQLDLNKALETLESAIKKIDTRTRTQFKETFEKVNIGLQALFPRLFGGGHAYLQLTEEDVLHAGVTIMARPPGKRISNIHLLSGGEKALTAVALVFSIFQLNPAPFCLLDEVDAPLDDANVGRFTELVREMSEKVQFMFVTHNKVTMEMAHQLSGVTMREAGVSRLVQVDMEEATRLVG